MAGRFVAAPPPASWGRGDGGYGLPMRNSQAVSGVVGPRCHLGGAEGRSGVAFEGIIFRESSGRG